MAGVRSGRRYSGVPVTATDAVGDLVLVESKYCRIISKQTTTAATVAIDGVVNVVKKAGEAWKTFQKLYWDASTNNVTTTDTSNTFIGTAAEPAASAATAGFLLLNDIPSTMDDL